MEHKNWFSTLEHGFHDVIAKDFHINAKKFLDAALEFTTILEDQTNVVFIPVKARFRTNVMQMVDVYKELAETLKDEAGTLTLNDLVQYDIAMGRASTEVVGMCRGIMWFTRSLQFMLHAFDRSLGDSDEDLCISFKAAYKETLYLHHDAMVQPLFNAAMLFCPSRDIFYTQLMHGDTFEAMAKDARVYFGHLRTVKERLVQYCVLQAWDVRYGQKTLEDMKKCYLSNKRKATASESEKSKSKQQKT